MIERAICILRKRGEIPEIFLDGHLLNVSYKSPRAENQAKKEAQNAFAWLSAISGLGNEVLSKMNTDEILKWLTEKMGLPANFVQLQPTEGTP